MAEDVQETVKPEDIRGQADRIRSLFQAAGRNGLLSMRDEETAPGETFEDGSDAGSKEVAVA